MLLCIDIGNTHITLGLFAGESLRHNWRLATDLHRTSDEYALILRSLMLQEGLAVETVRASILASVVPTLTENWLRATEVVLGRRARHFPDARRPVIPIAYDPPHEVGADRLADVLAVRSLYGCPACVVDFGTATTFDAIHRDGTYLGGAIAPGVGIAADALFQRTSLLPKVGLEPSPHAIGGNTRHAVQSGLFWGYASLVEGMIRRFREELGDGMQVIATGGLARLFAEHTELFDHFAPWLTLEGLRLAHAEDTGP